MTIREEHYELLQGLDLEATVLNLLRTVGSMLYSTEYELTKEEARNEKLVMLNTAAEQSKTEIMEKLEALRLCESHLREREKSHLQTIAQLKESLEDAQQNLEKERQINMQISSEVERSSSLVRSINGNTNSSPASEI
ncbi:hypothetical protein MBANPS3_005390 [Mucor bainieri]